MFWAQAVSEAPRENLFLPPCSLLWSGPAWSQARNSHYCLTRKAASSAEGGNPLPGTPCSPLPVIRLSLSTCLPFHGSLLTWVRALGYQCGSWRGRTQKSFSVRHKSSLARGPISKWEAAPYQGQPRPLSVYLWWKPVSGFYSASSWWQPLTQCEVLRS